MKFYVTERLGPKRSLTPEGFLLCQDVPVARVGIQDYHESELPTLEADRGVIRVQRLEDEVFKAEAMASVSGKSVVVDHPDEDVTIENWRELEVGTGFDPRRGEGAEGLVLLADLIIKDPEAIRLINEEGLREISLGYDAEYEMVRPGLYTQHSIIVNHIALVPQGRCGPTCSIGDHSMPAVKKPTSFKDRLMAAFKSKDEAAMEKLAGEVTEDGEIAEPEIKGSSANGITINVHGTSATSPGAETKDEDADKDKDDPFKKIGDAVGELTKCMKDYGERLGKLETGGSSTADADKDDEDDDSESTADADGDDDKDKDKDKGKTNDGKGKTRDSKGLEPSFQDTIARAEILSPGIKVPTFDAKMERQKTRDALCAFRRKALDKAYTTDEGKAAIDAVLAGRALKTKDMTCDAARILFTAASENMKSINRAATLGSGKVRSTDTGAVKVPTIGEMNKGFADFWKPKV